MKAVRTRDVLWFVWTLGLTLILLLVAARNLDNYPLAGGDEVWNLSVAHKLATEGVFGTDLFAGFSGADQHYFLALPLHHVWQAALFKVLGTGLAQARWVSLLAGVTILWVMSRLAYRWFGLGASLLTGLLLVFWRSDLIGLHPGLPLLAVARWGRHDVGAVAWYWLAVASLYSLLLHPRRIVALAVGMCCGAAALTHFYGAFVIPVVAVAWLWRKGRRALKDPLSYWILLGLALVLGPYVAYVTRHWVEFQGQMLINQNRMDLGDLAFYGDNVLREPRRLAHLVHLPALRRPGYRPLGPWLFWLGIGPAAVYLLVRARSKEALGARLLVLSLVLTWGQLALLEQVKAPLYLVVLVPGVCLALAAFGVGLVRRALELWRQPWARRAIAGLAVGCLGLVVVEGAATLGQEWQRAGRVSRYLDVGQAIDAHLRPGASVAGLERWWWALPGHPYRSLDNLWLQWTASGRPGEAQPHFSDVVMRNSVEFLLINPQVEIYIRRYPPALQEQFWAFVAEGCVLIADWTDPSYGPIEVHQVE